MTYKNNNTTLFIDIRNSDEVLSHRFDTTKHKSLNIPSNMIRFNLMFLRDLVSSGKYERVFIVCYTGKRSKMIYDKYFASDIILSSIIVDKRVSFKNFNKLSPVEYNDLNLKIYTIKGPSFNLYNMTRIVQLILGSILLLSGLFILYNCSKFKPLTFFMIAIGLFVIYSSISGSCIMSKLLGNILN